MDFFLQDPDEIRLPPQDVRLLEVKIMPFPDGKRVKVSIELTPFKKRPNIDLSITASSGREVSHASILETMLRKIELIMHLRESEPGSEHTLVSTVYYQSLPEPGDVPVDMPLPEPMIVDRQETVFSLPQPAS